MGGGVLVVFYLNFFLLIGIALRHWFKFMSRFIPYTVLLLIIGFALGYGAKPEAGTVVAASSSGSGSPCDSSGSGSGSSSGFVFDPRRDYLSTMQVIATLDPHTLLYIFLPALLFESAQVRRVNARSSSRQLQLT